MVTYLHTFTFSLRSTSCYTQKMATVGPELQVVKINSYVRGYHVYLEKWNPVDGVSLLLRRELGNTVNKFADAVVLKQNEIVGHLPFNLAPLVSQFLRRDCNKGFAIVTGSKVNRGAGYGLEVPCTSKLYGPRPYVVRLKQIVKTIQLQGQT